MSAVQPEGYLATPAAGKGSPVLVLHAWWGLNDTIKSLCTRLADAGFVAFAPDLYQGKVADTIADAQMLSSALNKDPDQASAMIVDSLAFLKEHTGSGDSGVAVIGFSLGAYFALDISVSHPDSVRSVVLFYGTGITGFSRAKADYLGHFAGSDDFEPESSVNELEESLREAGRPVTFYTYEGTGHWFFEPDRTDAYNADAASLAWDRTLAFLQSQAARA